jgi:polysaccharide pyruvyl transferase WcaK-like protein
MKVLVLWADHASANLGVRVLAEGTQKLVSEAFPDASFEFQDFTAPVDVAMLRTAEVVKGSLGLPSLLASYLDQFDVVVDTGAGDSFTDIYGRDRFVRRSQAHRIAHRSRGSFVLGPQTIGPFNTFLGRRVAARSLSKVDTILVRDSTSAEYAKRLFGRTAITATDVVFALDVPPVSRSRDVVVNASGLLWNENPHVDHVWYREQTHELVTELLASGRQVTVLAHVLDNPTQDNDMIAVAALEGRFEGAIEIVVPDNLRTARQAIASASAVVGARMHACLNALSVGVAAVPWAYSRKFAPLMDDLGWRQAIDIARPAEYAQHTLSVLERWAVDYPSREIESVREGAAARLGLAREALRDSFERSSR